MPFRRRKDRDQHFVSVIEWLESRCLLTALGDMVGDTPLGALNLGTLTADRPLHAESAIDFAGDRDVFQFQSNTPGTTVIALNAVGSNSLDTIVTLLDSSGAPVANNDDGGPGLNSLLTFTIQGGQPYYIEAKGYRTTTGDYTLDVSIVSDNVGDSPETAFDLGTLTSDSPISMASTIDFNGDQDYFAFRAETDGVVKVTEDAVSDTVSSASGDTASPFDGILQVFEEGDDLSIADDFGLDATTVRSVSFQVVAGQLYFVQIEGNFGSLGGYQLNVSYFDVEGDVGNSTQTARNLDRLTTDSPLDISSTIDFVGDHDWFQFQAGSAGQVLIALNASGSSFLDTVATLLDSSGNPLASNDDSGSGFATDSLLTFTVNEGQTYFVEARGLRSSAGDYQLRVNYEVGDTSATASNLGLFQSGSPLQVSSAIDFSGDVDVFQFQADTVGFAKLELSATESSLLDTVLTVRDSAGAIVAFNDDIDATSNSRLSLSLAGGQTYYVEVRGYGSKTGDYVLNLSIQTDQVGDTPQLATELQSVSVSSPLDVANAIESVGDRDVFQFQANATGTIAIQLNADDFSSLDPIVSLLDSSETVLASNNDSRLDQTNNSLLTYRVEQGQTYFVEAKGLGSSLGAYHLGVSYEIGDTTPAASDLGSLEIGTPLTVSSVINFSSDRDVFQIQPNSDGVVVIAVAAPATNPLDTVVRLLDSSGRQLATNDDSQFDFTTDSFLTFPVRADQTYFVEVTGFFLTTISFADTIGGYSLAVNLNPVQEITAPTANSPTTISGSVDPHTLESGGTNAISSYRLIAQTDQLLHVTLAATHGSGLDPTLLVRVLSSDGTLVRTLSNDDSNGLNSSLLVSIAAGQTLAVDAGGHGDTAGEFSLSISVVSVQTIAAPTSDLPTIVPGTISESGDLSSYRLLVGSDQLLNVALDAAVGSLLDPILDVRVLSSNGELVRSLTNDDAGGFNSFNRNSFLAVSVSAGQTIEIDARRFGQTSGGFVLTVSGAPIVVGQIGQVISGEIAQRGAMLVYQFPVTSDQRLQVALDASFGSTLDPVLSVRVLSATGFELFSVSNDDGGPGLNSLLSVSVTTGETLEIVARGFGITTGRYSLTTTADHSLKNGAAIDLGLTQSTPSVIRPGSIEQPGSTDRYRFTASANGTAVIDLVAAPHPGVFGLDPIVTVVTVVGSTVTLIGSNDDSGMSLNSHLQIPVVRDQIYDIIARGYSSSVGAFSLNVTLSFNSGSIASGLPDVDASLALAATQPTSLNSTDRSLSISGEINGNGDVDAMAFRADFTGVLQLSVQPGSNDLSLGTSVFHVIQGGIRVGAQPELIAANSDMISGDSRIFIPVDSGQVYVVRVAGLAGTGSYSVVARDANADHRDQVGDSLANAVAVQVGTDSQSSAIDFQFDRDWYRFTVPSDGQFSFRMDHPTSTLDHPTGNLDLDPVLAVYNQAGLVIARNDDAIGTNSRVTVTAHSGDILYVEATGLGSTNGSYSLSIGQASESQDSPHTATNADQSSDTAIANAATTALVSVADGAAVNGDRSPAAIQAAVSAAIARLIKEGKLTTTYLVLVLDGAPTSVSLTSPNGTQIGETPDRGPFNQIAGGFQVQGSFAGAIIIPIQEGISSLQIAGTGLSLGNSVRASVVGPFGQSEVSMTQVSGKASEGKSSLVFEIGFGGVVRQSSFAPGQGPSFFMMTNALLTDRKTPAAEMTHKEIDDATIARADEDDDDKRFDPLDPEAWDKVFDGVLQNLQFEGLSSSTRDKVLSALVRAVESKLPLADISKNSPVVRSAKAVYQALKQGAGLIRADKLKLPPPRLKMAVPKMTQDAKTNATIKVSSTRNASGKIAQLGGW